MLSRRERFPRALFPAALKGRRLSSEHFSVVLPGAGKGYAVVIPKKTTRLSVTRHKIKRRVLAALRTIPLPPAAIIFPRSAVSSVSYEHIRMELADLFRHQH